MRLIISIIIVLAILVGCGQMKLTTLTLANDDISAEQVIKDYFRWYNFKDKNQLNRLLNEDRANIVWDFDNLEYMRLISVNEEADPKVKRLYITNGRGKQYKSENIKVFKVVYEIKYIDDTKAAQSSGTIHWWYFLIKKDDKSPWLIDDWGV